jgi:transcriptional regulator with XRE-family HTH domain
MSSFGQYIRDKRESLQINDKSFSLRQVAERLSVQASYLSKIERSLEVPSEEMIVKIAKQYQENEDVLLAMVGKVSSRLQKIILKNPVAFASLISSLEDSPEHAILRVIREVKDGNW